MRRKILVAVLVAGALIAAGVAQARLPRSARELRAAHLHHRALPARTQLHLAIVTARAGSTTIRFLHTHPTAGTYRARQRIGRDSRWLISFGASEKRRAITRIAALRRAEVRRLAHADWERVAVPYADRVWPGTRRWLLDCSSSEGGHGRWVWNSQGSRAGGWMQFMAGTFYSNAPAAFAEARRRGVTVPRSLMLWESTVGQAVTAAYMRAHGLDRGQWAGRRC